MRSISDKQGMTLKAATRRSVDMAGGGDALQHVTRVKAGNLSKYGSTNEENGDKFMPIDVAVEADIEAGSPIILTAMAEILGYQVVPGGETRSADFKPLTVKDALRIANEAADVVKAITSALEGDDRIDTAEERDITREIDETIGALMDVMRRLKVRA